MMKTTEKDTPIAAQIVGSDPEVMLRAAHKVLENAPITFLDINAACPAKKVLKKKAGACLLRDSATLYRIIELLASSLPVPVTVKMRLAHQNETLQEIVDIARRCELAGARAIFVHGRTRLQFYSGDIDYRSIKMIKEAVRIPVIGSGNIFTPELAKKMLDETGCDGILVARGVFGNPWLFNDIEHYLKYGVVPSQPDLNMRKAVLKRHLAYVEQHNGSRGKAGVMRKVALWYIKSFPNAKKIRSQISVVKGYEKMLKFIEEIDIKDEDIHRIPEIQYEKQAGIR